VVAGKWDTHVCLDGRDALGPAGSQETSRAFRKPEAAAATRTHGVSEAGRALAWAALIGDGTRRLPNSPLIDTYLVPEAPQVTRSARHRPREHHRLVYLGKRPVDFVAR
jgi:hypothetical protein